MFVVALNLAYKNILSYSIISICLFICLKYHRMMKAKYSYSYYKILINAIMSINAYTHFVILPYNTGCEIVYTIAIYH